LKLSFHKAIPDVRIHRSIAVYNLLFNLYIPSL
jgi:hypothetical protein